MHTHTHTDLQPRAGAVGFCKAFERDCQGSSCPGRAGPRAFKLTKWHMSQSCRNVSYVLPPFLQCVGLTKQRTGLAEQRQQSPGESQRFRHLSSSSSSRRPGWLEPNSGVRRTASQPAWVSRRQQPLWQGVGRPPSPSPRRKCCVLCLH